MVKLELLVDAMAVPGTPPPAPPIQQPMPPPPPPAARKSKIPMLVAVFAVLGVVFMGISLALPWYTYKSEMTIEGTSISYETNFDFNGYTAKVGDVSNTTKWSDAQGKDNTKGVYSMTMILVVLGLVMCILLLVGAIMLMRGPGKKMLAMIFGILAFIFAMLGPVMFMVQHPGAIKSDTTGATGSGPWDSFSGSTDSGGLKITWGPAIGWMMALMGFIFALIGFILVLLVKKPAGM